MWLLWNSLRLQWSSAISRVDIEESSYRSTCEMSQFDYWQVTEPLSIAVVDILQQKLRYRQLGCRYTAQHDNKYCKNCLTPQIGPCICLKPNGSAFESCHVKHRFALRLMLSDCKRFLNSMETYVTSKLIAFADHAIDLFAHRSNSDSFHINMRIWFVLRLLSKQVTYKACTHQIYSTNWIYRYRYVR